VSWTQAPWQLSANLIGHSGWRRNGFDASTTGSAAGLGLELAERNASAWAPFVSLDLRASWRRPLSRGALRVSGEINNLTNRSNPCCEKVSIGRNGAGATLVTEQRNWLPRYVLFGVAWELP
jgi:TonB dependent receptor